LAITKTTIDIPRGTVDEAVRTNNEAIFVVKKPSQFQNNTVISGNLSVSGSVTVTGTVSFLTGSFAATILYTIASATASSINNFVVLADAISQSINITLPDATASSGFKIYVKKIDISANLVNIIGSGSQKIDGVSPQTINSQYTTIEMINYGSDWYII